MNYLLEILGSTVIGMFIILMIIQFNANLNDQLIDRVFFTKKNLNVETTTQVLEFDLYKIGFRDTTNNAIQIANNEELRFLSDIGNDNSIDLLRYYLGTEEELTNSSNPNDKPLYRQLNGGTPTLVGAVTDLSFTYFNAAGNTFTPVSAADRNSISAINVSLRIESDEPFESDTDTLYYTQEFNRTFRIFN